MFCTYFVHRGVLIYRQNGAFNSSVATLRKAYLAPSIILCGSLFVFRSGDRHPRRVSRATRPIPKVKREYCEWIANRDVDGV